MLLINIPEPCHENWNEMSPREQGAFCNVCSKTVIDFTSLSDEEVKNYFFANRGQKTCGRFKNSQLTNNNNPLPAILAGNIPLWKKFLAAVVILFGSFLTGCNEPTMGKMILPEKETQNTFVGITLTELSCETEMKEPKIEELLVTKGFTEPIVVGELAIIEPDVVGISELIPDSTLNIKPEIQRADSTEKIPTKNDCDSIKTDPVTFPNY